MATSFSIADILADVARTANVPAFDATSNVTLTQATYWLAQSARSLSALFRQHFGEDQDFLRTATLSVQANLGLVSLPADAGEVSVVLWVRTASDWRLLERAPLDDLEAASTGDLTPWLSGGSPKYRLEGETLAFYPPSSAVETVVLFYTKHLDIAGETTLLTRLDGDRWLTLDVVCRVLQAQGRDATVPLQDRMLLEKNLFSKARGRDPHAIHTIRDTRGRRAATIGRNRWSH